MHVSIDARAGSCIEWLPQDTIVFDGALADLETRVELEGDARYLGWEIVCLGRTGSGERYARGECRLRMCIRRDGIPIWLERGRLKAGERVFSSAAGLDGHSVFGVLAATMNPGRELLSACRSIEARSGAAAVTALPGIFVARYLGDSSEHARMFFENVWRALRPALADRDAVTPRIWRT